MAEKHYPALKRGYDLPHIRLRTPHVSHVMTPESTPWTGEDPEMWVNAQKKAVSGAFYFLFPKVRNKLSNKLAESELFNKGFSIPLYPHC